MPEISCQDAAIANDFLSFVRRSTRLEKRNPTMIPQMVTAISTNANWTIHPGQMRNYKVNMAEQPRKRKMIVRRLSPTVCFSLLPSI